MPEPRVAYLGERGAFGEEAVRVLFAEKAEPVGCLSFDEIFRAVASGQVGYAVAPMKNTLIGEIARTNELLAESRLRVIDACRLQIRLVLIGGENAELENLKRVESHYAALGQCKKFFAANPHLQQVVGADTASSARKVITGGDPTRAALASRRAAEIHGGKILREGVQDSAANFTTFYLVGN